MIFRFDDVSIRSDMKNTDGIADVLKERFPQSEIIYAISPTIAGYDGERVFPKIWNAYSDYRKFFNITQVGLPMIRTGITLANHGLFHVDHRLLSKGQQEISIIAGCSLVNSRIFVPPFNKWNKDTEEVCRENNIELVKFENANERFMTEKPFTWLCMEYNKFNKNQVAWYLHAREWTPEKVKIWIGAVQE